MNRFAAALFTAAVFPLSLFGQTRQMTIEESIALGLDNSRALHSSLMRSVYADAKSGEVSAGLYPLLRVLGGYQKLSSVPSFQIPLPSAPVSFPVILNNYNLRASFQQPLFTGWKLQSAASAAEYTASASHDDYQKDKAELVYNIKTAYWTLYRAEEIKRLTDESVNQIASHVRDAENQFTQGLATENDVLKVKVQHAAAQVMQNDAANAVTIGTISLNSLIGISLETAVTIATPLTPTTKEFPELRALLSIAFERRPDIRSMEWRKRAAEAGVTGARGGWLPQLFLTANYYYARPNQRVFPAKDEFKDTWDIGVSVQFDIWNNLSTVYQTAAAEAQDQQASDALSALKDAATLEVTQSYLNLASAKQRISLTQLGVDQANENYRVTKEKFKAGLTTNSELLDAEVAQLQAKVQRTQAIVDFELARARLEKAIGESQQ